MRPSIIAIGLAFSFNLRYAFYVIFMSTRVSLSSWFLSFSWKLPACCKNVVGNAAGNAVGNAVENAIGNAVGKAVGML